jgi:hypothetical protein
MIFSLKDLASKLSPSQGESLHIVKTNTFTLHHFQSLSGFVFVINTKPDVPGINSLIRSSISILYIFF